MRGSSNSSPSVRLSSNHSVQPHEQSLRANTNQSMQSRRRAWRWLRVVAVVLACLPGLVLFTPSSLASAMTQVFSSPAPDGLIARVRHYTKALITPLALTGAYAGTVYIDYNANGTRDTSGTAPNFAVDIGVQGIVITAYNTSGVAVGNTTSGATGTYSLTPSGTGPYRLEFTSLPSGYYPSAVGTNNGTTVRFVNNGGASGIDLGIINNTDYSQDNPILATPCYVNGNPLGGGDSGTADWLVAFLYGNSGTSTMPSYKFPGSTIGAAWGVAYQRQTRKLFTSALVKRHIGLGSYCTDGSNGAGPLDQTGGRNSGTGGIYVTDFSVASPAVSQFVDVQALGINTGNFSSVRNLPAAKTSPSADAVTFATVGKYGLGDLDLSEDGTQLWTVNLFNRSLVKMNVTNGAVPVAATEYLLSSLSGVPSCTGGVLRPWGLAFRNGKGYVGAVCTAETSALAADLRGIVLSFNPSNPAAGVTQELNFALNFTRGVATDRVSGSNVWFPWLDTYSDAAWRPGTITDCCGQTYVARPTPILADIDFDNAGAMILGFLDRAGNQTGWNQYRPDGTGVLATNSGGDLLRACPNAMGVYVLESNGSCGGVSGSGVGNGQGPGGGEFYANENFSPPNHHETSIGGLAQLPGADLAFTGMDPLAFGSGGIFWTTQTGGDARRYQLFSTSDAGTQGKSVGLGDLDILADPAPLQLGNRVWTDTNGNGVQDPGESGIQNVTVELWADTNSNGSVDLKVGQATTDSGGNYYFGGTSKTNMLYVDPSCTTTISTRVNASTDDAEETVSSGLVSTGGSDLELLYDAESQIVGVRFSSLAIPQGATITSAYIEFTPRDDGQTINSGNPAITIHGQAADNPNAFATLNFNISSRTTTTASVAWNPANWTSGTVAQTAALTSIVQELVNRTGWASGNSMAFIFSGGTVNAFRRAWSWNGSNAAAPNLVITYRCQAAVNPTTAYEIRIPNATGGSKQVALSTARLVTANTDPGANGDARDSDATLSSTNAVISLTTGGYGVNNHTYDFGFIVSYSAGNRVWYDTDNDGVMDGTEVGVNGVTVDLLNSGNSQIATTTTDSSGYYRFDGISAGTGYRVRIRGSNFSGSGVLKGYQNSTGNTTATDQRDNGVDPASNNPSTSGVLSSPFDLGEGLQPIAEPDVTGSGNGANSPNGDAADNLTVDFGFYCLAIGNLVFVDNNTNGTFDGGDVGLAGAGLALFQSDGTTLVRVGLDGILGTPDDVTGNDGTVNTNFIQSASGGSYQFKGLTPGSYIVRVYPPYGYKSTNDIASSGNPNNGTDNDDNGIGNAAGAAASAVLTLTAGSTSAGAIVTNSIGLTNNPTLDFGLVTYAPTAVRLTELTAHASVSSNSSAGRGRANPGVTLNWRTGFESDNLGFNLYRVEGGQRVRINPSLIAGSALLAGAHTLLTAGNSYTWTDAKGQPGMNYWLEELDLSGKNTWYGPVLAMGNSTGSAPSAETTQRSLLLAELNATLPSSGIISREWANEGETLRADNTSGHELALRVATAAPNIRTQTWNLPSQSAAKLAVRKAGWYRVTQAELAAVGFKTDINPAFLQLFTDGVEVPIKVTGKGSFGFESLEFYGRGLDMQSTDTRVYWLVAGNPSARRLESLPGKQPERVTVNSFRSTVERKERLLYFSALLNGEAENWFGALIRSGEITVQKLTTRYVDRKTSENVTLEIALQGVTNQMHVVNVELNGRYLGTLNFNNREHPVKQLSVTPNWLLDGENEIKLSALGGSSDNSLVDYLRLSYARAYRAENDALSFSLAAGQAALISGFSTPNIRVLQLSDGNAVREVTVKALVINDSLGRSYGFNLQSDGGAYLALADPRLERVAGASLNQPSDWRAEKNAADFLIITHSAFKALAEKLANVRRTQGWQVAVADVEDVYDEFSFGARTPQAIKDLFIRTRDWQRKPSHVLLVGAGTYDPRDYQGTGLIDFIPAKLGEMSTLETASENWFADTNDDGLPDLALGRLPVRNVVQAETVIIKLINFKPDEQLRSALLVSDRTTDGYDFRGASDQLARELPALMIKQFINRNDGSAEQVRGQIIQSINQSPLVVNWYGHGSVDVWTGDGLLRARDAAALTNRMTSLFVMTTCLNGYFIGIPQLSLSDALLLNTPGGAFAVVSSSALTSPVPQLTFNRQLYRSLFGAGQTLGDAFNAAKLATPDRDVRNSYVLLGDPTLQLIRVRGGLKR